MAPSSALVRRSGTTLGISRLPRYVAALPFVKPRQNSPWRKRSFPISNDPGVPAIEIGTREFMCVGAKPPLDHPHVFLDMGGDNEIICPYCSTLYRHDPTLDPR